MITNSSLRTKISFAVGLVIFIVLGTSTFVHIQQLERDYLQAIEWRAEALSQGILNQIMNNQEYDPNYYIHNPGLLGVFSLQCMQLYERNRAQNVAHISIINAAKIIAAHNDRSLWNTPVEDALLREYLDHQELATVLAGDTYHTLVPIVWNRDIYLGSIDIGFPKQVVDHKARELMLNSAILFCIYLIMAVFASSTLMHVMLRNISRIRQGIETLFHNPTYTLPPVKGEFNVIVEKINELVTNVAAMKKYEDELQKRERMAVLGEMALGVAHEIKNPLTSIKGFTQMLQRTAPDNARTVKYLNLIDSELNRVNKLLNELLVYGGRTTLQFTEADLEQIISEFIDKVQITYSQIRVKKRLGGQNFRVRLDKHKMIQVFDNLLNNAVEALTGKQKQVIGIFMQAQETEVTITFVDNGCGIHAAHLDKVLHPFFTTKSNGYGFGLAISYKILEQHGGNLQIFSRERHYTKIVLTLPKCQALKETL